MDKANPLVSALVIREGTVIYAGNDAGAREMVAANRINESVDLKGACVLPGLTDAHLHLQYIAEGLNAVNVEQPTKQQALDLVAEAAKKKPAGEWILGYGWNHNVWDAAFPTAAELDAIAPNHPVLLDAKSGHAAWVNSYALRMAGIDSSTAAPKGGEIVHDAKGNPSGTLLEDAAHLVSSLVPETSAEDLMALLPSVLEAAHKVGLTGVHDLDKPRMFNAEQALHQRGELTLRITKSIPLAQLPEALAVGLRSGFGDDMLRVGPVKMFADGAMGPRTAWMLEGYVGAPEITGIPATPVESLSEAVFKANAGGLAAAIHAIGDRATREVLDIYEEAKGRGISRSVRNRIEHVQLLSPADMGRLGQLGVIASMQPIHATSDMYIADTHWGARSAGGYALKSQLEAGAVLALGSDCPVEVWDPLVGIHAAVTRRRADGTPGSEGWHPEQRLTVAEAVEGFTAGPAYATGLEDRLGRLKPGFLGDCTILGTDIFEIDPMEILNAPVLGTVVNGRFVWRAPELV